MFQTPSKCAHCQSIRFELSLEEPAQSSFKVLFIRCAGCKNPIGAMPYFDTNSKIEKLQELLTNSIRTVNTNLDIINTNLSRLIQKR